ncbi:TetR family transcriptional regulator, partial [Streptomyces sp. NPDC059556]|uniref:TetR family transcriptional regulator n=1 Tax=Streptomyces sp. NPDC059556 TaxID=3346863 RepID=UPI00369507B4
MGSGVRALQREQTRHTLLSESRRLFSTHGYAAVNLSQVVEAAGVTKGALYHHFESKSALFQAVLEEVQEEVGPGGGGAGGPPGGAEGATPPRGAGRLGPPPHKTGAGRVV